MFDVGWRTGIEAVGIRVSQVIHAIGNVSP
jgi:hypothetical protein